MIKELEKTVQEIKQVVRSTRSWRILFDGLAILSVALLIPVFLSREIGMGPREPYLYSLAGSVTLMVLVNIRILLLINRMSGIISRFMKMCLDEERKRGEGF